MKDAFISFQMTEFQTGSKTSVRPSLEHLFRFTFMTSEHRTVLWKTFELLQLFKPTKSTFSSLFKPHIAAVNAFLFLLSKPTCCSCSSLPLEGVQAYLLQLFKPTCCRRSGLLVQARPVAVY